jgi:methionyl-tRNA synthetase
VCAWPNRCTDLVEPHCNRCGSAAQVRQYQQLMFPLNQYAGRLREFCAATVMSPQLEALCSQLLATELPDIPISHPTGWGIPVPVPGFTDQRIYVWAEMVPGYFAGVANSLPAGAAGWREVWNSPETELVQFFGFDNGYFHTLLHPALLMAYDPDLRLPDVQVTNEFYLLDDAKFSKSRGHTIKGADLLAGASASVVRFVLAHDRPEARRTTFSWQRFGQLCDSGTPQAGDLSGSQRRFLDGLQRLAEETLRAYSGPAFSPQRATRCLIELVRQATEFAAGQARLRAGAPDDAALRTSIAVELAAARTLAALAWPVMPDFGRQLWTALGCPGEPCWDGVRLCDPGQRVAAEPVFFQPYSAIQALAEVADV